MMKSMKRVCMVMAALVAVLAISCASTGGGGGASAGDAVEGFTWSFDDVSGWKALPDEYWDYKGTVEISTDSETFGKPMLRVDVDYSNDSGTFWSEAKLGYTFGEPFNMAGTSRFTFDIIYHPEFCTKGGFRAKVIAQNGTKTVSAGEIVESRINPKDEIGDGWLKATVSLRTQRSSNSMDNIVFGIAGYQTDYKGPIYFDNMSWK